MSSTRLADQPWFCLYAVRSGVSRFTGIWTGVLLKSRYRRRSRRGSGSMTGGSSDSLELRTTTAHSEAVLFMTSTSTLLSVEFKTCTKCLTKQPLDNFYLVNRRGGTERHPHCIQCRRDYAREYYRARIAEDPDYGKRYSRKATLAKYGLTPEEYDEMFAQQNGRCAICDREPEGNGVSHHNLVVDHDHETGKVRALLCDFCNRGIGIFREDPDLLMTAAAYLLQNREV